MLWPVIIEKLPRQIDWKKIYDIILFDKNNNIEFPSQTLQENYDINTEQQKILDVQNTYTLNENELKDKNEYKKLESKFESKLDEKSKLEDKIILDDIVLKEQRSRSASTQDNDNIELIINTNTITKNSNIYIY